MDLRETLDPPSDFWRSEYPVKSSIQTICSTPGGIAESKIIFNRRKTTIYRLFKREYESFETIFDGIRIVVRGFNVKDGAAAFVRTVPVQGAKLQYVLYIIIRDVLRMVLQSPLQSFR